MLLLTSEYGDVFSHNIAAVQKYWRTAMSRLREEPNEQDEPLARRAEQICARDGENRPSSSLSVVAATNFRSKTVYRRTVTCDIRTATIDAVAP